MVIGPVWPPRRKASAARPPACPAPTMTTARSIRSCGFAPLLCSSMLGRIDEQPSVDDMHSPGPEGDGAWRGGRTARADVKASLMERTFDLGSHDEAFGQRPGPVSALILSGIKPPSHTEDGIRHVLDHHANRCVGFDLRGRTQSNKLGLGYPRFGRHLFVLYC